jgi:hypothetical protein
MRLSSFEAIIAARTDAGARVSSLLTGVDVEVTLAFVGCRRE